VNSLAAGHLPNSIREVDGMRAYTPPLTTKEKAARSGAVVYRGPVFQHAAVEIVNTNF
jgi:hypothetical protein